MNTNFDDISLAYAPSCTIEDAVLYLMGFSQSQVQLQRWKSSDDPSGGEFLSIVSYQDLAEEWNAAKFALEEAEKYRDSQFIKAGKLADLTDIANENPNNVDKNIADKLVVLKRWSIQKSKSLDQSAIDKQVELDECTDKYKLACLYRSAISNELLNKESSLIRDNIATQNENNPYILLLSLKNWASKVFNIEILNDLESINIKLPNTNSSVKSKQKMRQQEIAVLDEIKKLGHDPKRLPKIEHGKLTLKAQIKKILLNHILFKDKKTVFKHTWERLSEEDIAFLK